MPLDDIPPELLDISKYDELVLFIRSLPIHGKDKVYIFIAWCKHVEYDYSQEDINLVRS